MRWLPLEITARAGCAALPLVQGTAFVAQTLATRRTTPCVPPLHVAQARICWSHAAVGTGWN